MKKIIPFAFAIILVLAGGFYLFSQKIIQSPKTQTQTTTEYMGEDSVGGETPTPLAISAAEVNQITLSVTSPLDKATVAVPSVTVKGITSAGADVAVNEKDVTAGSGGVFSATISLEEGDNYIIVVAVDEDGLVAEQELTVTYTPAE